VVNIIISATSDIGSALCHDWRACGEEVVGTFRDSQSTTDLESLGVRLVHCDLVSASSLVTCTATLVEYVRTRPWDKLVLAAGTQNPVGLFTDNDFSAWRESVEVNFLSQTEILHALLPYAKPSARVLLFAGGGTNGAVSRYSAYTIAKIASIKLCELLAEENPSITFFSLGPGWVRTKIHQETIDAGSNAGDNLARTRQNLASNAMVPMRQVVDTINRLMSMSGRSVSGRNFSAVNDPLFDDRIIRRLEDDVNLFKLRRNGNDLVL
jgi:NAD(P)-dependent dehydrogenase (short-subunit alcohol dehydrogenase family)